jgi:putative methyltransferase (TIGR04325 family)
MTLRLYRRFADALAATPSLGYNSELLVEVISEKTKRFRDALDKTKQLTLGDVRSGVFLASILKQENSILNILDFGGACGFHYHICRALRPSQRFDWRIVETKQMIDAASKSNSCSEVSFFSSVECATVQAWVPLAVFASSSLQYHPDPLQLLDSLLSLRADYVFITRTPLSLFSEPLCMVQQSKLSENGPGPLPSPIKDHPVYYPVTFIPRQYIYKIAESKGYKVTFSIMEEKASIFAEGVGINQQESILFTLCQEG